MSTERLMTNEEVARWRVDAAKQCPVLFTGLLRFDTACLLPMPCERHAYLHRRQLVCDLDDREQVEYLVACIDEEFAHRGWANHGAHPEPAVVDAIHDGLSLFVARQRGDA